MIFDLGFGYFEVLSSEPPNEVVSIIARLAVSEGPLQAVIWNVRERTWEYDPGTAALYLYDERNFDQSRRIERSQAEQVARDILGTELPTDEKLRQICTEGLRADQDAQ